MISIAPLARDDIARVAHLTLGPGQDQFVAPIWKMTAENSDVVDFHVILDVTTAVGFFKIDRDYAHNHDFADPQELGLRGLLICATLQGLGIGSQALTLLPDYLRVHYPSARSLILTVNVSNPAAYRTYCATGFQDTGEMYLGGGSGPQHVMRLML